MVKAVTFDFWNTVYDSSSGVARNAYRFKILKDLIAESGAVISELEFKNVMTLTWEYFNNIWKNDYRTPSGYEMASFILDHLNVKYTDDNLYYLAKTFGECLLIFPPKLLPGVKEVIKDLHKKSYKLGIVSDTGFSAGYVLRKLLNAEGLIDYFSAFSFSDETRVSKPHHIAFKSVLEIINVSPSQTVHIGDIEDPDIKGAKSLGMKAIRYYGDSTGDPKRNHTDDTIADASISSWYDFHEAFEKLNS